MLNETTRRPSIAIIWGSSTGYTEDAARALHQHLDDRVEVCLDIADTSVDELTHFDVLILGVPTWHVGELQDDWEYCFSALSELDLRGKTVALFGCGDADGYPYNFQDALGIMWRQLETQGATLIGCWPTAGYDFFESRGVTADGASFFGLALDEHSQCDSTEERIARWARQLRNELAVRFDADSASLVAEAVPSRSPGDQVESSPMHRIDQTHAGDGLPSRRVVVESRARE
ncbi:MAG: flavodoxin [Acidobacteriota bacterium]